MLFRVWHNRRIASGVYGPAVAGDDLLEVFVADLPDKAITISTNGFELIVDNLLQTLKSERISFSIGDIAQIGYRFVTAVSYDLGSDFTEWHELSKTERMLMGWTQASHAKGQTIAEIKPCCCPECLQLVMGPE